MTGMAGVADSAASRYTALRPHLDERQRRLLLGVEAQRLGRGGIKAIAAATGVHPDTIARGVRELDGLPEPAARVRAPGGGRKKLTESAFAVATLRRWWNTIGRRRYPDADRLLICADGGGSNGYRAAAVKVELAALAAETGLAITVCHLPPGTCKWNKIEHRLFSQITMNWRGRPLKSHGLIVDLSATTTTTGLTVHAVLDTTTTPAASPSPPRDRRPEATRCTATSSTATGTTERRDKPA